MTAPIHAGPPDAVPAAAAADTEPVLMDDISPLSTVDTKAPTAPPLGSLLLIGGAERFSNTELWTTLVEAVGGPGRTMHVLPMASGIPTTTGPEMVAQLQALGLQSQLIPVGIRGFPQSLEAAADDPTIAALVASADGLFLLGGDQSRIIRAMVTPAGEPTLLDRAVRAVYQRGGLLAGTSAGTAVMSDWMYRDAEFVLPTLLAGVTKGREIDRGLGFLPAEWFVDQHFLTRGRFGRALAAMRQLQLPFGLGVEEDTALLVRQGRYARVVGYRGAVVLDLSEAECSPLDQPFAVRGAFISYLNQRDEIDLATREVTPSPEMQTDRVLLPGTPEFRPYYRRHFVSSDIFGNMTLHTALVHIVDAPFDDAIGLAFDPVAAMAGNTEGFEFRFYRAAGTRGWNTGRFGGDDYTVVNVGLDVRPITIHGPLYDSAPAPAPIASP